MSDHLKIGPVVPSSLPAADNFHGLFLYLSRFPAYLKPVLPYLIKAFLNAAERCAVAGLAAPGDATLLAFPALPKIGLGVALGAKGSAHSPSGRAILDAYPRNIPWPANPLPSPGTTVDVDRVEVASKLIEQGRFKAAKHILLDSATPADAGDPAVMAELQEKHPQGTASPFGDDNIAGPPSGRAPTAELLQKALRAFNPDTAPGISGWTVRLLRLALLRPKVKQYFLSSLVTSIACGKAPGQQMLLASRLTALTKPNGSLRHIAVGEPLYRLAGKTLLLTHFRPDYLLTIQFGVKSPGGVEPLVAFKGWPMGRRLGTRSRRRKTAEVRRQR
ncbi:hypothetical protein IAT38_003283 [Cryptococcus sp. DSM 104549]